MPQWSVSNDYGWVTKTYAAANQTHGGIPNDEAVLKQIGEWIAGAATSSQVRSTALGAPVHQAPAPGA